MTDIKVELPLPEPRPVTPESPLADHNQTLANWIFSLPEEWRQRKCVLCSLFFVFIFYPCILLVTLVCGDSCLASYNQQFFFILVLMVFMLHLIQIFISMICMRACFYDNDNEEDVNNENVT